MFYTYIVTNRKYGTLYTGHTDDLIQRVWQHKHQLIKGFSSQHGCNRLVWFDIHETRNGAFKRERQIKEWIRQWKINRIEEKNPDWRDLFLTITDYDLGDPERMYSKNPAHPVRRDPAVERGPSLNREVDDDG